MTDRRSRPTSSNDHKPLGLRPDAAQGGPAVHPRHGQVRATTSSCPGCSTWRSCARRWRTPASSASTPARPRRTPRSRPVVTGDDARRAGPGLDADAVQRRPGGARHRQGPLPGPGGRVRRRRGPLLGTRRARADRRRVRAARPGRRRAQGARPRRAADPRRPRGQDRQPLLRLGDRRRRGDRGRLRRRRRRRHRGHRLPARAPGTDGDLRLPSPTSTRSSGKLTLWTTIAGAARPPHGLRPGRRPARAQDPRHLPRHRRRASATRCRSTPGYVCAIVGSLLTGKPVKWMEDRTENLDQRPASPATTSCGARSRRPATARSSRIRTNVLADHGAFNGTAAPVKYPAGFFGVFTGSYDLEAALLQDDRRLHQQGARRRRLRVLVPHHRGGVPASSGMVDVPRRRARHGPGRAAPEELHPARAVPVRDEDRLGLRLRRLRAGHAPGHGDRRLRRAAARAGREARAAAS